MEEIINELDMNAECKEYLQSQVEPFLKGFDLISVQHTDDKGYGTWVFIFERNKAEFSLEDRNKLEAHMYDDDDSQPSGQYREYIGTLWYFRPYYM